MEVNYGTVAVEWETKYYHFVAEIGEDNDVTCAIIHFRRKGDWGSPSFARLMRRKLRQSIEDVFEPSRVFEEIEIGDNYKVSISLFTVRDHLRTDKLMRNLDRRYFRFTLRQENGCMQRDGMKYVWPVFRG